MIGPDVAAGLALGMLVGGARVGAQRHRRQLMVIQQIVKFSHQHIVRHDIAGLGLGNDFLPLGPPLLEPSEQCPLDPGAAAFVTQALCDAVDPRTNDRNHSIGVSLRDRQCGHSRDLSSALMRCFALFVHTLDHPVHSSIA